MDVGRHKRFIYLQVQLTEIRETVAYLSSPNEFEKNATAVVYTDTRLSIIYPRYSSVGCNLVGVFSLSSFSSSSKIENYEENEKLTSVRDDMPMKRGDWFWRWQLPWPSQITFISSIGTNTTYDPVLSKVYSTPLRFDAKRKRFVRIYEYLHARMINDRHCRRGIDSTFFSKGKVIGLRLSSSSITVFAGFCPENAIRLGVTFHLRCRTLPSRPDFHEC